MLTLDERIAELMQGKYSPYDRDNLAEALANLDIDQAATIANLLKGCRFALLGAYVETVVREHWYKLAKTQAECDGEREYQSSCERCHGAGCSWCNDREFPRRIEQCACNITYKEIRRKK
jgi:hypothetical protein